MRNFCEGGSAKGSQFLYYNRRHTGKNLIATLYQLQIHRPAIFRDCNLSLTTKTSEKIPLIGSSLLF